MIRGEEPALGTPEPPRYGNDAPWMGEVVIQAKHLLVWLAQLSQRYGTPIRRLDEIPEEECNFLRKAAFAHPCRTATGAPAPPPRQNGRANGLTPSTRL